MAELSQFLVATFPQVSPGHQAVQSSSARGFAVPAGSGDGEWGVGTLRLGFPSPPDLIKEVLSMDDEIQKLATELYHQKSVLIMGRGYHYATCLEGALVRSCDCRIHRAG